MTFITMLLSFIGILSTGICIFLCLNKAIEIWFDIQTCKRDVERLERQIKNLQCNREP
ncbi:MAG: hypothetical protein ACOYM3_30045 [Terrimicrobiaceae bacterium]